eukprot:7391489-Prymnesium_polylepis.1
MATLIVREHVLRIRLCAQDLALKLTQDCKLAFVRPFLEPVEELAVWHLAGGFGNTHAKDLA